MNQDTIQGKWTQLKGKVKEQWGKLTDDDIARINGRSDVAVGRLQELYGYERERAEKEWNDFCDRYGK